MIPAALTHDTALTVWSPLAGGLLTGKYLGQPITSDAAFRRPMSGAPSTSRRKPTSLWRRSLTAPRRPESP